MTPKEFIETVFVQQLDDVTTKYPYMSFAIIATGIEFLGKCLDKNASHWNVQRRSKKNFEAAINQLNALEPYRKFLTSHQLWDSLRNGFSHSFVPKHPVTLTSGDQGGHLMLHSNDRRINLRCEDFYSDFQSACREVLNMEFPDNEDKMNKELLAVPK